MLPMSLLFEVIYNFNYTFLTFSQEHIHVHGFFFQQIPPVLDHRGVLVQLGHKDLEHPDLQELLELVLHQLEGLVLGPLLDQWEPLELVMGHLEFQGHLEALDLLEVLEQTQGHLQVLEQTQVPLEALEVVEALV